MSLDRRHFLAAAGAVGAAAMTSPIRSATPTTTFANSVAPSSPILTSVKWGMIREKTDLLGKFKLMKELGYDGVELVSPLGGLTIDDLRRVSEATSLPIHGVVDMVHWRADHQLSSPDPKVRARGRNALEQAVRDAHALGGSSVLLVPGVVNKGTTEAQCAERSTIEVQKVLPLAAKLGIHILIENVWNGFCYSPEKMGAYIDGYNSPWVGSYFDIGNHVKYGKSEHWIRTLGRRIVKLDIKDWGKQVNWCKIGDGDTNWPEVRKALKEIGFTGWSTAEVRGGGRARLTDIKSRIDKMVRS
ncbi:MAG: xylose isomerase [Deltaproteobacteria bacterium]|nr:xylose isomerase [Deltaproteobacteria bacterium]